MRARVMMMYILSDVCCLRYLNLLSWTLKCQHLAIITKFDKKTRDFR